MASYARQTGASPVKEEAPALSGHGLALWHIWMDLHAQRRTGMALDPITYADIESRGTLLGETLRPWEVMAIRKLDDAYRAHVAEVTPKPG